MYISSSRFHVGTMFVFPKPLYWIWQRFNFSSWFWITPVYKIQLLCSYYTSFHLYWKITRSHKTGTILENVRWCSSDFLLPAVKNLFYILTAVDAPPTSTPLRQWCASNNVKVNEVKLMLTMLDTLVSSMLFLFYFI